MPDYTDKYAKEKNLYIYIEHIPTGEKVKFKALLKAFSDNFDSSWNSEEVYGRMDPIQTFQGTKRVIEFEWEVVSYDIYEAEKNLYNTDKLANFLYPVYADYDNSNSIVSAPVLKIKLSNLISQPSAPAASADGGLVGRLDGFRYTPDFESGVFFGPAPDKTMYPQTIAIQGSFHVFHTHDLGWGVDKKLRTKKFPHGARPPRRPGPPSARVSSMDPNEDAPPPTVDPEDRGVPFTRRVMDAEDLTPDRQRARLVAESQTAVGKARWEAITKATGALFARTRYGK